MVSAYQKEFLTKMLFSPLDVPVCLNFGLITSSFLFQKSGIFFFSTEEDLYFLSASGIVMASTYMYSFLLLTSATFAFFLTSCTHSTVTPLAWLYFTHVPAQKTNLQL